MVVASHTEEVVLDLVVQAVQVEVVGQALREQQILAVVVAQVPQAVQESSLSLTQAVNVVLAEP